MKYYQLMSGDTSRDFSRIMFDFGVAIVGSGNEGPITEKKDFYINNGEWPKLSWLQEIEPGDRIVLHSGQSIIQGVGEVILKDGSVYHYSDCFEDVDGWSLQHFCYVNWKVMAINLEGKPLSRSTAKRLHAALVIDKIEAKWDTVNFNIPKYDVHIPEGLEFDYDKIERGLIGYGMRIEDAETTIRTLLQVEKLAKWYLEKGASFPLSESEIRAFLVVPILYALGWSYQKMSLEFDKIDISLFQDTKRDFPVILIETKTMWTGSVYGVEQVKRYMKEKAGKLTRLKKVIVTDGLTYWLYDAKDMGTPLAYMSLRTKKMSNPAYPEVKGMLDFIKEIMP